MEVHEGRLARHLVVAVGHRDDQTLVQSHDEVALLVLLKHRLEEADLVRAGVGEDKLDARFEHLGDKQLTSRALKGLGHAHLVSGFRRPHDRPDGDLGDAERNQRLGEVPPRQLAV